MAAVRNCVGDGEFAADKEVISELLTAGAAVDLQDEVSAFTHNIHTHILTDGHFKTQLLNLFMTVVRKATLR